ncbi:hypothetical protein J3F83DRAFT_720991, partial [Trichoderma novae-zelandiae]
MLVKALSVFGFLPCVVSFDMFCSCIFILSLVCILREKNKKRKKRRRFEKEMKLRRRWRRGEVRAFARARNMHCGKIKSD